MHSPPVLSLPLRRVVTTAHETEHDESCDDRSDDDDDDDDDADDADESNRRQGQGGREGGAGIGGQLRRRRRSRPCSSPFSVVAVGGSGGSASFAALLLLGMVVANVIVVVVVVVVVAAAAAAAVASDAATETMTLATTMPTAFVGVNVDFAPLSLSLSPLSTKARPAFLPLRVSSEGGGDDLWATTTKTSSSSSSSSSSSPHPPEQCPTDPVSSPVLRQAYGAMRRHWATYGHANIPLGTSDGRKVKTIRRLAFQNKLSLDEMSLLRMMNFRFRSFEEVYDEADFDECLNRLIEYEKTHQTGYQIPKKYAPDPELGAWVTLIRRIGRDDIDPERRDKLDAIGFAWTSLRKCGSSFMKTYRPLLERLEKARCSSGDGGDTSETVETILAEEEVAKWLRAQREAYEKGNLSESRVGYLDKLTDLTSVRWREQQ